MEKEAETKREIIEDRAELRQQLADLQKLWSKTNNALKVLQASEARYRRIFEAAQDGILILDAKAGQKNAVNPYQTTSGEISNVSL